MKSPGTEPSTQAAQSLLARPGAGHAALNAPDAPLSTRIPTGTIFRGHIPSVGTGVFLKTPLGIVCLTQPERAWSRYTGSSAACPGGAYEVGDPLIANYEAVGLSSDLFSAREGTVKI